MSKKVESETGVVHIVTNGNERDLLTWNDLTLDEQRDLNYVLSGDWSGFRYRGNIYDLDEFEPVEKDGILSGLGFHGVMSTSFFSAIAVKFSEDYSGVVVAFCHW